MTRGRAHAAPQLNHVPAHSPFSPGPTRSVTEASPAGQKGAGGRLSLVAPREIGKPTRCSAAKSHAIWISMTRSPCGSSSLRFKRIGRRIARLHDAIANLRRDFVHKATRRTVQSCDARATEQLAPKTKSGSARGTLDPPGLRVRQMAGLNRELISAPSASRFSSASISLRRRCNTPFLK